MLVLGVGGTEPSDPADFDDAAEDGTERAEPAGSSPPASSPSAGAPMGAQSPAGRPLRATERPASEAPGPSGSEAPGPSSGSSERPSEGSTAAASSGSDLSDSSGSERATDERRRQPVPPSRSSGSMTMDPMIGRVIADRYEILQRIGAGGMGSVYRARQQSVAQQVALKVLRPDLINNDHIRQRFHREAEIIARLRHPNTIRLFDFCTTEDGLAVMVMELLEGQPLSDRLKSGGPLGVLESLHVGIEVSRSLSEAHLKGLVHRDLKPANIFLSDVGGQRVTKVLDFGIARLMDEEATRLTVTDQVFGTPRYMSPEQGLSTANVDARSDLYSLGLILYECVVGQPPFVAQTSYQYLSAHSAQPPPKLRDALPNAPESLERLIDACLEKQPERRPQSADAVADQLEAIRRSVEAGGPEPDAIEPTYIPTAGGDPTGQPTALNTTSLPPKPPAVPSWIWAAVMVLAILVGVVAALAVRNRSGDAITATPLDAGPAIAQGQAGVTPPKPLARLSDAPDAGFNRQKKDQRARARPDAGKRKKVRKKRRRRKPKQSTDHALVGPGAVAEPRSLVIPIEPEKNDLLRAAVSCEQSVFRGLSRISTKRCPADCAILVDATCAGKTPASGRPIPPGRREVAVVCEGKLQRTATVRFVANDVTEFRCR